MRMFRFRDADVEQAFYREVFGLEWGADGPNTISTGPASKPSVGSLGNLGAEVVQVPAERTRREAGTAR